MVHPPRDSLELVPEDLARGLGPRFRGRFRVENGPYGVGEHSLGVGRVSCVWEHQLERGAEYLETFLSERRALHVAFGPQLLGQGLALLPCDRLHSPLRQATKDLGEAALKPRLRQPSSHSKRVGSGVVERTRGGPSLVPR